MFGQNAMTAQATFKQAGEPAAGAPDGDLIKDTTTQASART